MNILIRVDSKNSIGIGHFMRCLTLAKAMRQRRCTVAFAARDLLPKNQAMLEAEGFLFFKIDLTATEKQAEPTPEKLCPKSDQTEDARFCAALAAKLNVAHILVDHYALDKQWEQTLSKEGYPVTVLDDLANREHACDVLIDYTLGRNSDAYSELVPSHCKLCCGAAYTIIKSSVVEQLASGNRKPPSDHRVVGILMGGTDPMGFTGQVLAKVADITEQNDQIIVVLGPGNKNKRELVELISQRGISNATLVSDPDNYAELLNSFDLAISACGSTAIELICLDVPCILVPVAKNQLPSARAFSSSELARVIHVDANQAIKGLQSAYTRLIHDLDQGKGRQETNPAIFDGKGHQRILNCLGILPDIVGTGTQKFALRPIGQVDLDLLLSWRNHPDVRGSMYHQALIQKEQHYNWHKAVMSDPSRIALIFCASGLPTGYVSFELDNSLESNCATWGFYLAPGAARGMGQMLGETALNYAFSKLKLDCVFGEVISNNLKSQNFHQRMGFRVKGTSQKTIDHVTYSINEYVLPLSTWEQGQQFVEALHA